MSKQHKNLDNANLHDPKDFSTAANETAPVKDINGLLEWRSLTELGSTGPQGPAGTSLVNIEVANINDASVELSTESGVTDGDIILIHETVVNGPNPLYTYAWDTDVGTVKADPPFIIPGDGGFWVNTNIYYFQGKCSADQLSPSDYHGRIFHVHRQGRWYGLHMGGEHQILSRNGYDRSALSGDDVSFHEHVEDKVKTKTLSSNTTLTFSGYQLLDEIHLEIQSTAGETLAFPSYATIEGKYDTSGVINFIACKVNNTGIQSTGTITIINNSFDAGDSVIVNGVAFTEGSDWVVGADTSESAFNICRAISESNNADIVDDVIPEVSGNVITIRAYSGGIAGDSITLVKSDGATNNITLSGPTLTGGANGEVLVKISQANNISISELKDQSDRNSSTGIIDGGELSVNGGDNTKFDIADGSGIIVDSYTDPNNPVYTEVVWSGLTAQTPTGLGINNFSFIGIDVNGTVVQQVTPFTSAQKRDIIKLGSLIHVAMTTVEATINTSIPISGITNRLDDMSTSLGIIKIEGAEYSANGANLNIDRTESKHHSFGSNYNTAKDDPDIRSNVAEVIVSFFQSYRDGLGGSTLVSGETEIDPDFYDDGTGTLSAMPSGEFQTKRVYFGPGGGTDLIEYGQTTFKSMADAEGALFSDGHLTNSALDVTIPLHAWLIVQEGTTDLTDVTKAKFIQTDKLGQLPLKNSTTSTTNMQQAYDNSVIPQTVTDSTRGAITFEEGTSVGGDVIDIRDDSQVTQFSVAAAGTIAGAVIATQGEAEAGTASDKIMTPERVNEALAANATPATKEMFFSAGADTANDNNYSVRTAGSTAGSYLSFFIPHDYTSIVSLELIGWAIANVGPIDIDINSSYAAIGESVTTHQESDTAATYNFTANQMTAIDISSIYSSISSGDFCGLYVDHNGISTTMKYIGIRLRYN